MEENICNGTLPCHLEEGDLNGFQDKPETRVDLAKRLEDLYSQANVVKMLNFKKFIDSPINLKPEDVQKLSQLILKAIEVQLRVLAHLKNQDRQLGPDELLDEIWTAITSLPLVRDVLAGGQAAEELLNIFKNKAY